MEQSLNRGTSLVDADLQETMEHWFHDFLPKDLLLIQALSRYPGTWNQNLDKTKKNRKKITQ